MLLSEATFAQCGVEELQQEGLLLTHMVRGLLHLCQHRHVNARPPHLPGPPSCVRRVSTGDMSA